MKIEHTFLTSFLPKFPDTKKFPIYGISTHRYSVFFVQQFLDNLAKRDTVGATLMAYASRCLETTMKLFTRYPNTKIDLDVSHGDVVDTNMFLFFRRPGKTVAYLVWPCIVLNNIVVSKGVVQVVSPSKEDKSLSPHMPSLAVDYSSLAQSMGGSMLVQYTSDFEGSLCVVPPPPSDSDDESKASSDSVSERRTENKN